jgi:hypothetical protein
LAGWLAGWHSALCDCSIQASSLGFGGLLYVLGIKRGRRFVYSAYDSGSGSVSVGEGGLKGRGRRFIP